MKFRLFSWILILAALSLISTRNPEASPPQASLICVKMTPSVLEGKLTPTTVLEADFQYSINKSKLEREKYSITILFGSSIGQNQLFNKKKTRLGNADFFLEKSNGTVTVKYPMDAVWMDDRLKRPISVVYYIIEHDKNGASQAIASAGPYIFRAGF